MTPSNSVFTQALSAIRRRPFTLWLAALWPYLLLAMVCLSIAFNIHASHAPQDQVDLTTRMNSMGPSTRLGSVLAFIVAISLPADLAASGVSFFLWTERSQQTSTFAAVFRRLAKVILPLVFLSLFLGAIGVMGGFFLVLPGFLIFALTAFVIPILVIGEAPARLAVSKGLRLAGKKFGALILTYGLTAITLVIAFALLIFVQSHLDNQPWWVALAILWFFLGFVVSATVMVRSAIVTYLLADALSTSPSPFAQT